MEKLTLEEDLFISRFIYTFYLIIKNSNCHRVGRLFQMADEAFQIMLGKCFMVQFKRAMQEAVGGALW